MKNLSAGEKAPDEVNVFVEIPQGSYIKYELDKEMDIIFVDRFNYTAMAYPFNYGFIPETKAQDGDPIDVVVISTYPVHPGVVIQVRPIGMLEMQDEAGIDTKIIAVPTVKIDPFLNHINDISDLDKSVKNKIKHFFDHYKELEPNKWVKTNNFLGKDQALNAIKSAM